MRKKRRSRFRDSARNLFNSIMIKKPGRNVFNLDHSVKMSMNMGWLVPSMVMECVPGDIVNVGCNMLVRFAPLVNPVMHAFHVTTHTFFCPIRLVWENFEEWACGNTEDGPLPAFPTITINKAKYDADKLIDYMGIPDPEATGNTETISAVPFAVYQKIYNDYYRDQNLIDEIDTDLLDGSNDANLQLSVMRLRSLGHDYLTSALPFAQKGPSVQLPIGRVELDPTNAPVPGRWLAASNYTGATAGAVQAATLTANAFVSPDIGTPPNTDVVYDPAGSLVTAATYINDLRTAFRLQEFYEKDARGGTRYTEKIRAHFGVKSSDARLQRPEYITGTKSPVMIGEVLNTTGTEELPQANMAGTGISTTEGAYGKYYCEEHGYIMTIMSILPRTAYQQGIPKHFLKTTDAYQLFWPEFANLGEQPILNKEVMAFQGSGSNTFGYTPRYAEYKFMQDRVAGDFKTSLNTWQAGRIFETPPALNQQFIECNPDDYSRIFAVTDSDTQHIYVNCINKITANRLMPKYGTPTF